MRGSESPCGVERTSWAFGLTAGRVVRRDCGARTGVVLVESKISSVVKLQMLALMMSKSRPWVYRPEVSHSQTLTIIMPSLELITNVKVS